MATDCSDRELAVLFRQCVGRCLPFWHRHGVDHELGGFFGDVRGDGSLDSDHKGGWCQGFGIWLFAYFYNHFGDGDRYLEAARRGWRFTARYAQDGDEYWVMNLSRTGDVIEGATSVLTDAYLAHGLVELFRADADEEYVDIARETLLQVRERMQRPDFCASTPSYTEPHSSSGAWGTVLGAVSDYLHVRPNDSELAEVADLCLHTVLAKHLDQSTGLIVEVVAPDGGPYTGRQRDVIKPGAAAETCTAIMMEADRRGDRDLRRDSAQMLRAHYEAGWDEEYGGMFYEVSRDGRPAEDRKDAWAQAEFMRGLVTAGVTDADDWIKDAYARIHNWAFDAYADEPDDLWRLSVTRDGKPTGNRKVDMFHHPRMLLSILETVERGWQ
jgi:N-acylglucosamine 2-epimerase